LEEGLTKDLGDIRVNSRKSTNLLVHNQFCLLKSSNKYANIESGRPMDDNPHQKDVQVVINMDKTSNGQKVAEMLSLIVAYYHSIREGSLTAPVIRAG
jgi:recombinational DNA repair ATPase RecF